MHMLRLHPTCLYYRNCFSDTIIILPNWITILTVSNQGLYKTKRVFKYACLFFVRMIFLYRKCLHCFFEVRSQLSRFPRLHFRCPSFSYSLWFLALCIASACLVFTVIPQSLQSWENPLMWMASMCFCIMFIGPSFPHTLQILALPLPAAFSLFSMSNLIWLSRSLQAWNLSKKLHRRIFRLKILHRQFHLISTVLVRKNTKN